MGQASALRLSENGYFSQSPRQVEIITLEILPYIPVVIISAFPSGAGGLILKKISHYRRIYFGTDYDNQRNGEIFKIARNNDM